MLNFNKNKLINKTLENYYKTFACTLDTADYVPHKFNEKIRKYIFKNLKRHLRKIDKEDRIYQNKLIKAEKLKKKKLKKKSKKKSKLALFFSKLFKKKVIK